MKSKLFNSLFMTAMAVAVVATSFVSCKDYDDDINDLRNQISSNVTDLTSLVNDKISTVESEISSLQAQASVLEAAYEAADEALQATLETKIADAASGAQSAAEAYSDIQAAQAQAAAIAAAEDLVNSAVEDLQGKLDEANKLISGNSASITDLIAADAKLTEGITAAQAKADKAYDLAESAQTLAESAQALAEQNQSDIADLTDVVKALTATVDTLKDKTSVLPDDITEVLEQAAQNSADITALQSELGILQTSNDAALEALNGRCDSLATVISQNQADIEKSLTDLETKLEGEITAQINASLQTANAYADAAAAAAAATAASELEGKVNISIDSLATAYHTADQNLAGYIGSVQSALQNQIDNLNARADSIANLDSKISALEGAITNLEDGTIKTLSETVTTQGDYITVLQNQVANLNKWLGYEIKRLKSLVFAPSTYVNGIAAIKFSTLQYVSWGDGTSGLESDGPATGDTIILSDNSRVEEYLASPSNVDKASIASLSFISNTATEITRTVSQEAPVSVADGWDIDNNGVITLTVVKDNETSFGTTGEFTTVALKAVIADSYKTEDEIAANEEVAVYSDWARLYEESVTPLIHNIGAKDNNDNLIEDEVTTGDKVYPHFLKYTEAYGASATSASAARIANSDWDADVVVEQSCYDYLDLDSLVLVCGGDGTSYDLDDYHFKFTYNLMPYNVDEAGGASSYVDQELYAYLTTTTTDEGERNILLPTANRGSATATDYDAYKREAVGHTPVVQIVLWDTLNNQVVDVKYVKIKWIEEINDQAELDIEYDYECGGPAQDQSDTIFTVSYEDYESMVRNQVGLSVSVFAANYSLTGKIYAKYEDIATGTEADATLYGTVYEGTDSNGNTVINWTIPTNTTLWGIDDDDYNAEKKVVDVWTTYESADGGIIAVDLVLTMNIEQIAFTGVRNQSYWSATTADTELVNPQLYTDAVYGNANYATTQFLASLLAAYWKEGTTVVPSYAYELSNKGVKATDAYFVFDYDKLQAMDSNWYVTTDGKTLYYGDPTDSNSGAEKAAVIDSDDHIQLYESGVDTGTSGQTGSEPTEAAKKLVGSYAPVSLVVEWCDFTATIEWANINFLAPLEFVSSGNVVYVKDMQAGGSSSASIVDQVVIKEISNLGGNYVYANGDASKTNQTLVAWYGVEDPDFEADLEDAKCNLELDGSINPDACNTPLSDVLNANGDLAYRLSYDSTNNAFVYENNSGNAIQQEFKIEVTVHVKTKWQDDMSTVITIVVQPAASAAKRH